MTLDDTRESDDPEDDRLVEKLRRANDVWGFFGHITTPAARQAYSELWSHRWKNVIE